jgi:Phosphotransferase enzyme family
MREDAVCPWPVPKGDLLRMIRATGLRTPGHIKTLWTQRGRHNVALVHTEAHGCLFIKRRGAPLADGDLLTLEHEIQILHTIYAGRNGVRRTVPEPRGSSPDDKVLITRGYPDHHDFLAAIRGEPGASGCLPDPAPLAQAVAAVHRLPIPTSDGLPLRGAPVMTHGRVGPADLSAHPYAYSEFLRLYQQRGLDPALRNLKATWKSESVIHGDFTASNILYQPGVHPHCYILTDWELSGIGDPLWDIGSLVGSLIWASLNLKKAWAREWTTEFLRGYSSATSQDVDIDRVLAWAGYWVLQRTLALPPQQAGLSPLQWSALDIVEELLVWT